MANSTFHMCFHSKRFLVLLVALSTLNSPLALALDESDLLFDIDSIEADDFSDVSPWYGSVSADSFLLFSEGDADSQLVRSQTNLTLGWQQNITETLYGLFELTALVDSTEFSSSYTNDDTNFEIRQGDAWLDWRVSRQTSVKFGSQTFGLSSANSLRVLDFFVPTDARIAGYGDLHQLKLPLIGVDVNHQQGQWAHRIIVPVEKRFDRAYWSGEFAQGAAKQDQESYIGAIYQLSYQHNTYDWQTSVGQAQNPTQKYGMDGYFYQLERFVGGAFGFTHQTSRYIAEARCYEAESTSNNDVEGIDGCQLLLGLNYTGLTNTQIQLEASQTREDSEEVTQLYGSVQHSMMRDALSVTLATTYYPTYDASVTNLYARYDWSDTINTTLGSLVYTTFSDSSDLEYLEDNDLIYFSIGYFW